MLRFARCWCHMVEEAWLIINVNPDHFVHITTLAPVKNCSLFELVKTNNQDQLKGDMAKLS